MAQDDTERQLSELITKASSTAQELGEKSKSMDAAFQTMKSEFEGIKAEGEKLKAAQTAAEDYAKKAAEIQDLSDRMAALQKRLDNPLMTGSNKDKSDYERKCALEFQKRAWDATGGSPDTFKYDESNLIDRKLYMGVVKKLMGAPLTPIGEIVRGFSREEMKVYEDMGGKSGLGVSFFMPEFLGIELNCEPECGYILDLYGQLAVKRSRYAFIRIKDYAQIGEYGNTSECRAPLGDKGNITIGSGVTSDYRGAFCFNREELEECSYDLLGFMFTSVDRAHRIALNRELMVGEKNGIIGWASGKGQFPVLTTAKEGVLDPADVRLAWNAVLREYGDTQAVMHQNTFAMISVMKDAHGNFIYGRGEISFTPEDVKERIRVSNCLPDPTNGLAKGPNELASGQFVMGAANWKRAYYSVSQKPISIVQNLGMSGLYCVAYEFQAKDGGFVGCPEAGRILQVK